MVRFGISYNPWGAYSFFFFNWMGFLHRSCTLHIPQLPAVMREPKEVPLQFIAGRKVQATPERRSSVAGCGSGYQIIPCPQRLDWPKNFWLKHFLLERRTNRTSSHPGNQWCFNHTEFSGRRTYQQSENWDSGQSLLTSALTLLSHYAIISVIWVQFSS